MTLKPFVALLGACGLLPVSLLGQITVTGVTDKATPDNNVTLTIGTQAGFDYSATLNWQPIAVGAPVVISKPDFYELRVDATNQTTSAITSLYRRFIVNASERVGTEMGIPPHVPFPVIQSASNEFAGAHLRLLKPASFPVGYSIPLVAWAMDDDEHPVRANGILKDAGSALFQVRRGVGSGFVTHTNLSGTVNLNLGLGGALATNASIALETGTVWTPVSGTLNGATVWPANSRIHAVSNVTIPSGSSLTIGEGSIVRLNSRVDLTNNGTVTINGTLANPVIFMPATNGQPWGGFISKTLNAGDVTATATIFTGSGGVPNWFPTANPVFGGTIDSHRKEQCLFFMLGGQQLDLTDSAAMSLAGQFGHSWSTNPATPIRLTRFLMQKATTGGEFTGAQFTANESAFIECPDDSVNFVDGDNDGLYLIGGIHNFTNTLFGWTKDDGIDSGGTENLNTTPAGRLTYQSCWFESTFHEGNSLSGYKNVFARDTVYFDCGQGIEDGYDSPTSRVDHCFFSMNKSGLRHGDNYATFSQYEGPMTATNNISIYNHRDLFGFNWDNSNNGGWTNNYRRFGASNNIVSALDTNYPNNTLWDPVTDAWRLGAFGGVGRVGVGFGVRAGQTTNGAFPDGLPVGLSRFCTNEVQVGYSIQGTNGAPITGTLIFPAGLTRRFIPFPANRLGALQIALVNPINADITATAVVITNFAPPPAPSPLIVFSPLAANWRYLDDGSDQGTAWYATNFNDITWSNGVGRLGFGADAMPLGKTVRRFVQQGGVDTSRQVTNYYFRRAFIATNLADIASVQFRYQRDDGCIVYLNGREMFRNNITNGAIVATNFAMITISPASETLRFWTNTFSITNLIDGTNLIAAEVHQSTATSSDIAWDLEVGGVLPAQARLNFTQNGSNISFTWRDSSFALQEADLVDGPWRLAPMTNSPVTLPISGNRFFRLAK